MRTHWTVTRRKSDDFADVQVYDVKRVGEHEGVRIWVVTGRPSRCTACQTPLRGMSATCMHVRAVKRFLAKESQ